MIRQLYWNLYKRYYKIPCRGEIKHKLHKAMEKLPDSSPLIAAALMYSEGFDISSIATVLQVTRERVRLLLLKVGRYK
jgi:DNA-directed RNA polymerase specialized sigma subunit